MARVTVEDCIERVPNRFDLVLTASQRARGILKGDLQPLIATMTKTRLWRFVKLLLKLLILVFSEKG